MDTIKKQYVTDEEGKLKAVLIPIEEWERIEKQMRLLLAYSSLEESLKQGFFEARAIISGNKIAKSAKEFLDEL